MDLIQYNVANKLLTKTLATTEMHNDVMSNGAAGQAFLGNTQPRVL